MKVNILVKFINIEHRMTYNYFFNRRKASKKEFEAILCIEALNLLSKYPYDFLQVGIRTQSKGMANRPRNFKRNEVLNYARKRTL